MLISEREESGIFEPESGRKWEEGHIGRFRVNVRPRPEVGTGERLARERVEVDLNAELDCTSSKLENPKCILIVELEEAKQKIKFMNTKGAELVCHRWMSPVES